MKLFSIPLGLTLAALSLLAAGTPTQAGERPFQAEGRGILSTYNEYTPVLVGSGIGEHLGGCRLDTHLNWSELWEYANVVPQALILEAANGDHLIALFDSEMDPETGIVAGTITIAGGTGRFADASGSASLRIVPDTSWFVDQDGYPYPVHDTQFSWSLDGTIDY